MEFEGIDHVYEYVPNYRDNRSLSKEEQIVIGLKVIPSAELDAYQRSAFLNGKKFTPDKAQEVNEKRYAEIIKSKVAYIRNLKIKGCDGEIDFDVLRKMGPPEIVNEILRAVLSTEILSEGEQKNFWRESDSVSSAPAEKD